MRLFLDSANLDEIRRAHRLGVIDGVTTNPSLFAKVGGSYETLLAEICTIVSGPVSAEVIADDADGMVAEGRAFARIAPNIVVKVPISAEGLAAISRLASEGIATNCTLIFSANQGLLAARAGATLLSPFVGRLDDSGGDGIDLIRELAELLARDESLDHAELLAASIRSPRQVTEVALAGADVATPPFAVLEQLIHHPLTEAGIARFKTDWAAATAPRPRSR